MAPSPITPSTLPLISFPAKRDLPFSTVFAAFSSPASVRTHSMPSTISREASNRAHSASSLTPLALAPGVLNTTTPAFVQASSGMLLTPAPARAMASSSGLKSISSIFAERTIIPCGASKSVPIAYSAGSSRSVPTLAILFRSSMFFMTVLPFLRALTPWDYRRRISS